MSKIVRVKYDSDGNITGSGLDESLRKFEYFAGEVLAGVMTGDPAAIETIANAVGMVPSEIVARGGYIIAVVAVEKTDE